MNMCEAVWLTCIGIRFEALSSLTSARASPSGLPVIAAAPASASNSREREIADWISMAAGYPAAIDMMENILTYLDSNVNTPVEQSSWGALKALYR